MTVRARPEVTPLVAVAFVPEISLYLPRAFGFIQYYEDNVIDLLLENRERLGRGEEGLKNQFV